MFSSNWKIASIFKCLMKHFYLIYVCILTINLYTALVSVCNYTFSYRNIQVRRRIVIH